MWMPLVFAIISFFSYRYYRNYVYYKLVFIVYEALCLMAFLALMLSYIGSSTEEQIAVMRSKDKRPLPWPAGVSAALRLHLLHPKVLILSIVPPASVGDTGAHLSDLPDGHQKMAKIDFCFFTDQANRISCMLSI